MRVYTTMKLLTVQDVCRKFNIHRNTLLNWRNKYNFPEIRIVGDKRDTVRFDAQEITEWTLQNKNRLEDT